ncbi:P-selectin-like [Danio aesculapii]|uniref:P-selectin-like n=1 Tax=Danio aesculapii TaxID=1142201 RepID=UPI0024BFC3ED|nr:P-selectin-like [Danio aesculapii]
MTEGGVKIRAIFVHIGVLMPLWMIMVHVEGWKYVTHSEKMTWNDSRKWCQTHHTDIVMVHNENVTNVLKTELPNLNSAPYYWIGMKKINDTWMWVANGQAADYINWAETEPNNRLSEENCVEMYITSLNKSGKWNDDSCSNSKYPVCHKAQCPNITCGDRKVCVEKVNNFSCVCKPGFLGPQCNTVVSCPQLSTPAKSWMQCSGLYGNYSLDSKCKFSCAAGYKLKGTAELNCNSSGAWNAPLPSCAAECFPLLLFGGRLINCTEAHDSSRSACTMQCPPGHLLLGFAQFSYRADGTWESAYPIMCANYIHFLIALLAFAVISMFCGYLCGCCICKKSKEVISSTQQETINPAYEAEPPPLEGPLCSA